MADVTLPHELPQTRNLKGRGANSNRSGRYEAASRQQSDDGWGRSPDDDLPPLRTTLTVDTTRTVITYNKSPDLGFDRSINPYRGCEHGCVYCFARPTHAYLGLSPGLDFETRLFAKPDAADLLRAELAKPGYRPRPIAMGTNTDPYQPIEQRLGITRSILEVLLEHRHPVTITTKSARVLRDLDLFTALAADNLIHVALSVTTLDADLARKLEPRAATPTRRLAALQELSDAGIPTAVMVAPVMPALTDHELEAILERAADAGVTMAGYILLRLAWEIKDLLHEWLQRHTPDRAAHVLNAIRATRGGNLYVNDFGERMRGRGPAAELLEKRFRLTCKRLQLNGPVHRLTTDLFRRQDTDKVGGEQLSLI
ncbi:MAG: PA0069 family radical SAM protein [Alphaproteobacteria bacterium]